MTTDNAQGLDELKHILGHCPGGCNKPDCWFNAHCHLLESEMDEAQVQALLEWHNKQVEEVLDRLESLNGSQPDSHIATFIEDARKKLDDHR